MDCVRTRRVVLGAVAACLVLAGCASKPEGVLIPFQGPISGTSVVDLVVATTRVADDIDPGYLFSGERADQLAYADNSVPILPDSFRNTGLLQCPC